VAFVACLAVRLTGLMVMALAYDVKGEGSSPALIILVFSFFVTFHFKVNYSFCINLIIFFPCFRGLVRVTRVRVQRVSVTVYG